jgi:outer membrane assembly lipoprotein YfiO
MRRWIALLLLLPAAACFPFRHGPKTPAPVSDPAVTVDSLWRRAQHEFNGGHWGRALQLFERVAPVLTPVDPRYLQLHFFQGEIHIVQGNQLQAVREFRRVADEQPESPLAPDALLRAGDAYADLWRRAELDPTYGETAKTVYEEVVSRYGGTPSAGRAALRLAALNEKFAEKEYRNAVFYFRFKAYDSAILMLRSVIATYPRASIVPAALERLVRAYQILEYKEDVKETCAYIAQYHPDPSGPARLCPKASDSGSGSGSGNDGGTDTPSHSHPHSHSH